MTQNVVQQLPPQTVKLITSTQIVTSVGTAVKELFENSIDAGAKVIQVRLENYGLDVIEVKDDGSGVSYENVQKMFLPGYTSKIRQFEDLDNLNSYGFRGEALAAICKIAKVSITTKTNLDVLAMTYEIDPNGQPLSSKPSHLNNGTVVTVSNLFSNLPVRRLFLTSKKKISEELKKTEQIVQSLSLIHPELSVVLIHNKCPIWRKNSVKGIKQSFMQVAGLKTVSKMEYINKFLNQVNLDLIVPKKNLDTLDSIFTNSAFKIYVYVNKRPVTCKNLSQAVQEHIFHHFSSSDITFKYAICLVSVSIPPQKIDINLEPNKTKVLIKNQVEIIKLIDEVLKNYYGHDSFTCTALTCDQEDSIEEKEEEMQQSAKRPKLDQPDKTVGKKRTEEFKDKNQDWELEIINDDCVVNTNKNVSAMFNESPVDVSSSQSLCSQINSTNSLLTTEELSEFNVKLSEGNHKPLFSINSSNSESRLIDRGDIQSRAVEQKPILKEWPCRPKVANVTQQSITQFVSNLNENENKAVEEIAEEIEKSVEEWTSEMMKAINDEKAKEDGGKSASELEEAANQFDFSMLSVSSQMGKKEMKAFTKFARIMRPKITEEFPNIKFVQIAGILADRWKALSTDEVKYYEKIADVVDINRKVHQEVKLNEPPKAQPKPKKSPNPKNPSIKSVFEKLKKNKISRPTRKEISFPASLDSVRKSLQNVTSHPAADCDIQIIGKLHPSSNWLYIKGDEIGHIRHQGLKELIVHQKMLNSLSVPTKALEKPILVSEENLGTDLWNVLLSLELEFDLSLKKFTITSDVIIKNGFRIEVHKNGDAISSAHITEVPESIPHFGITELKDALRLYQKNGDCGGLVSWRPTPVCGYITNEAIRIAHENVQPPDREEMENMLNTYHLCFRHLSPLCLHYKEIFPSIFNLQNETVKIQETKF